MRRSGLYRVRRLRTRRHGGGVLASAATVMVHGAAVFAMVFSRDGPPQFAPPIYRVELVAAPEPAPDERKAPEALQRPAAPPVVIPSKLPSNRTVPTPPLPTARPDLKREPAPRSSAPEPPAPGVKPSTGTDVATVKTSGVEFPYPEYLHNLIAQVYRRWQRPTENVSLKAEVLFFIHRDGTVTDIQFVRRSGNFGFDLQAQGAIESAANAGAFGRLPEGFEADLLPVNFFFNPESMR